MALKEMRNASRTWVAGLFVGLLVISFAVWGVADIFTGGSSRGIARVGDTWITPAEFQQRYRADVENFRQQTGQTLTPEQARALGVTDRVLSFLIDTAAVEEMGRRIGLAASDETVKNEILTTPAFEGIDGRFDSTAYERVLREYGYTPTTYEESLRGDIIRRQMFRAVMEGTILPRGLVETLIEYNAERRAVSYVIVSPDAVADPPAPSDDQLQSFLEDNPSDFSTPELRSFAAILLTPEDFVEEVSLSEDELKDQYEFDISNYTVPEKRSVRSLAFTSEAEAVQAAERIKAGESFEAIGQERGLGDEDVAFQEQTQAEIVDSAVSEAVFAAAEPGLVGPIDGQLAWSLVEIAEISPGTVRAFEDVRDEIRLQLARSRSEDLLYEIINSIEDSRAEGQTIEEIADRLSLRLVTAEDIDAEGATLGGETPLADIGDPLADLLAEVFAAEEGLENDFQQTPDGSQFVVRVDRIEPPRLRELSAIKDDVAEAFLAREQRRLVQERAQDLMRESQSRTGLSYIANQVSSEIETLDAPINRQAQSEILSASLIQDLFSAPPGELAIGNVPGSDNWVIAGVTEIIAPRSDEVAAGVTQVSPQLDTAFSSNILDQFVRGLRDDLGVRIDERAVEATVSGGLY